MVTLRPRFSSSAPMDADASPLPSDDTTPPVTRMNLVCLPLRAAMSKPLDFTLVFPTRTEADNSFHTPVSQRKRYPQPAHRSLLRKPNRKDVMSFTPDGSSGATMHAGPCSPACVACCLV